jgi:hypothetical protein
MRQRLHNIFFILLLCPYCCGVVSGAMVEQEGFVEEISGGYNLSLWWRRRAVDYGDPEAWKVVCGWRIWSELSTTSMRGGGFGGVKAWGRSLFDMP